MKLTHGSMRSDEGFVYVASCKPIFYAMAVQSCNTLKQCYPNANVTLFTHERFLTSEAAVFDNVVTNIPEHTRAKMWCMARTPYTTTAYIDCDSIVDHGDVQNVFDALGDSDYGHVDIFEHSVSNPRVSFVDKRQEVKIGIDCSFAVYRKTPLVQDLLDTWFVEYLKQQNYTEEEWNVKYPYAYYDWKMFDTFTMWQILMRNRSEHSFGMSAEFERFNSIVLKKLPPRFNSHYSISRKLLKGSRVITQIDREAYTGIHNLYKNITPIIKKVKRQTENLDYKRGKSTVGGLDIMFS